VIKINQNKLVGKRISYISAPKMSFLDEFGDKDFFNFVKRIQ